MIHPTAIIHPKAQVDSTVEVGPYAIIDAGVEVGPHCHLGPHVHLTGVTSIGAHNQFHTGCVIGDAPQDVKYKDAPTRLRVGEGNVFREYVTVHRSAILEQDTVVGSNNYLMAHCHLGHNVVLGNHIIVANGALLGGHVSVGDRVFISGHCLVHQFARIGTLALMQGGSGISRDLPPYTVSHLHNGICGLNTVGLRRAGFTSEQRLELRRLYHALFRSRQKLSHALAAARMEFISEPARVLLDFVAAAKRGVCVDTSRKDAEENIES